MFIMDCTGSMTPWIEECKNSVLEILKNIKTENSECRIRTSFVGYRDFDHQDYQFEIQDFTEN